MTAFVLFLSACLSFYAEEQRNQVAAGAGKINIYALQQWQLPTQLLFPLTFTFIFDISPMTYHSWSGSS